MLGSRQLIIDGETKAYRGVILSPHNRGFRGPIERCVSKIKASDFPASKISLFFRHQDCSWSPVGGTSDLLVTGMIEWRLKSKPPKSLGLQTKPKKIPAPKFSPQKIPWRISEPLKFQESINLYNTKNSPPPPPPPKEKKIPTYTELPKIILAKTFLPKKNPKIENFKPKKSFDHPRRLKSGVPPWELVQNLLKGYDNLIGWDTNSAGSSTLFQN